LLAVAEGTVAVTGSAFFRSLVKHLACGLHVRFAFVAECMPKQRPRSLAFWKADGFGEDFEYDLPGTPCTQVAQGRTCHFPDGVPGLFPEDKGLIDLGTASYLGVPLFNAARQVIGHVVVFDDKPMPPDSMALSVVEIFAARAGAELEREQARRELGVVVAELKEQKRRISDQPKSYRVPGARRGLNPKPEGPKPEGNPKSEGRNQNRTGCLSLFGFRSSDVLQPSVLRIYTFS
jgi:hypothetical protein